MTTTSRFSDLGGTQRGRTDQITRAYRGAADEMKYKQAVQPADCDQPQTLEQALRVIADLQNKLADAQNLIDDMRAAVYSNAPAAAVNVSRYWNTQRVLKESNVRAVSTITRHAVELGGIQMADGDWLFPEGTVYKSQRKRKSK